MTTQIKEQVATLSANGTVLGRDTFESLAARHNEPSWMLDRRREAWRLFRETPWPKWPRTDISGITWDSFHVAPESGLMWASMADLPDPLQKVMLPPDERSGLLVDFQGAESLFALNEEPASQGVYFASLGRALREAPDLVREKLMTYARPSTEGKFEALVGALWNSGLVIYVPADVEVALPLQVLHWLEEPGIALFPHTLIIAGRNSRVTVTEEYVSDAHAGEALHVGATDIWLDDGAQVTYLTIQNWNDRTFHFATQRAVLNRDAVLNWTTSQIGSRLSRVRNDVVLSGNGSTATLQGLYFPDGAQHIAQNTLQHHEAVGTTSDLLYKGVLLDQSRSVYEGLIRVDPGAQRTDAYQANRNLMLSRKARADSMPQLEIEANDVRCSHGATIGQLDENEVFYLMSRGLNRDLAKKLIVDGFFSEVLDRIPLESVQHRLRQAVEEKLGLAS